MFIPCASCGLTSLVASIATAQPLTETQQQAFIALGMILSWILSVIVAILAQRFRSRKSEKATPIDLSKITTQQDPE